MGLIQIASGIFAVAKAVPKVMELVELVFEKILESKISEMEDQDSRYILERRAISNSLETLRDRDERKAFSIRLAELNRDFMSNGH